MFSSQALLDLLDQVEDAIMEEELPVDPGNKGGQATNKDNTNNRCSRVADGDLTIPSKKTINAPPFNSFLVLEVYLLTSSSWFKLTPNSSPIVKEIRVLCHCVLIYLSGVRKTYS